MLGVVSSAIFVPSFAFAETNINTAQIPQSVNTSCVHASIEKREQSLIAAHQIFNTTIIQALTTRADNLKTAWSKSENKERRAAIKLAHSNFKSSQSSSHQALRAARTNSWNTYESDMRACGVTNTGESPSQVRNVSTSL